jgi:hypothetical protein
MTTKQTKIKTQWVRTIDAVFLIGVLRDYALTVQESNLLLVFFTNLGNDSRKKRERSNNGRILIESFLTGNNANGLKSRVLNTRFETLTHLLDELKS